MLSPNPIQVERYLRGLDYPASKKDLIQYAENNKAPTIVLAMLNRLHDHLFNSLATVTKEAGRWH